MIKKIKMIHFIAGCLILSGCANSPSRDYHYKPKALSKEMVNALHEFARKSNENDTDTLINRNIEFNEKQSLLKFTITIDDRYVFRTGLGGEYFDKLCKGTEPFFVSMRENGVGLQFNHIGSSVDSFGPWNSDACTPPSE